MTSEVRMANDIAVQFGYLPDDRAAESVAGHIQRFWDPRMRARLVAHAEVGAVGLDPLVVAAVVLLRQRTG